MRGRYDADAWQILRRGRPETASRHGDDSDRLPRHVKEFDAVTSFGGSGNVMPLDDRAHIAGAQSFSGQINSQDGALKPFHVHRHSAYIVINRGASMPTSICQMLRM